METFHQTKLQQNLETFRKAFPITKVLVEDDRLLYIFKTFYNAVKTAQDANDLIQRMGLPLVAIHYGSCSFFTVQSNEIPDI